jgi:tetratricopeptide (TPR) repeat protein
MRLDLGKILMRLFVPALATLLVTTALGAGRHKLDIDPESEDGILLQRIQQEPLPERKLAFLEKYVAQYPKAASVAWVYEQLLPIYVAAKQWDKVLGTAQSLLELDASDLDSAFAALQAAEAQKDPELVRKYAIASWDAASKAVLTPKPADTDDVPDWTKQIEFANQAVAYSEYVLASQAALEANSQRKTELIQALEQRNPQSKFLAAVKRNIRIREEANPAQAFAMAEKGLATDPNNEDYLMRIANHYMSREEDLSKVLSYSLRVLEVLDQKRKPEGVSAPDWEKKKARYTGGANWMIGVVYGKQARYGLSDRYLRAALDLIQDDAQLLAAAYFYLGYDNYALAGQLRDKARAIEAAKFSKLCLAIEGPFQPLAQKNLEVLRNDFNVE